MAIDELNSFFRSVNLPDTINLAQGVKIINVPDFIEGHLNVLNLNGHVPEFAVFYDRLIMIRDVLTNNTVL